MVQDLNVVMLGASGAVGGQVLATLETMPEVAQIMSIGRRQIAGTRAVQPAVDVMNPATYRDFLTGQDAAICTFGVGQPSRVSQAEFLRVDHNAVLDFARACKAGGVGHFTLLGSVGAHPKSGSFYLRTKGQLETALEALGFARLSLFRPSMILTPHNRFGAMQGLTLAIWPKLTPLLAGPLEKYRGIEVAQLGRAMARNLLVPGTGTERLEWARIVGLGGRGPDH